MKWENYEHEDVFAAERKAYPREQYEADRAKLIAEGVDPRLIMSYTATLSYMAWEAEQEIWESYDEEWTEEDERQMREAYAELEREKAAERELAAETAECNALVELVELAEENALTELEVFGNAEPWFYGEPEVNVFGVDCKTRVWSEERIFADDEEYAAWDAATDDIPEKFFELDWSM